MILNDYLSNQSYKWLRSIVAMGSTLRSPSNGKGTFTQMLCTVFLEGHRSSKNVKNVDFPTTFQKKAIQEELHHYERRWHDSQTQIYWVSGPKVFYQRSFIHHSSIPGACWISARLVVYRGKFINWMILWQIARYRIFLLFCQICVGHMTLVV